MATSTRIKALGERIQACRECERARVTYLKFPFSACGNPNSPIWIVGADPPHLKDHGCPRFWSGNAGRNLREPIQSAFGNGSLERLFYLTDIVKCHRQTRRLSLTVISNCTKWIVQEARLLKPQAAIVLGNDAANIFKSPAFHGSLDVVFLPHPSPANSATVNREVGGWHEYHLRLVKECKRLRREYGA
ncbi:MAG: uracil-DNA glycosylase family protein [candidate division Zixibacteria bacterium]|nr:uracil-DNA glycosylase family protein [candidate division Zixibacteria bacterium]